MLRRITFTLLFFTALLILLALGTWSYISTHQQQISTLVSKQLSRQLNTPVMLQKATLGFHPIPTLDFEDVKLTVVNHNLKITIPKIQLQFSWHALLQGNIICSELIIIAPDIHWQITQPTTTQTTAAKGTQYDQLDPTIIATISAAINKVKLIDGTLHIIDKRLTDTTESYRQWQLRQINTTITAQAGASNVQIQLNGMLNQEGSTAATLSLHGQIEHFMSGWSDTQIQLHTRMENIHSTSLHLPPSWQLSGNFNANFDLDGQIGSGLNIVATINNPKKLSIGSNPSLEIKSLELNTTAQMDNQQLHFRNMKLQLNELIITATSTVTHWRSDPYLLIKLHSNPIKLAQIIPWLPRSATEALPQGADQTLLQCKELVIAGAISKLSAKHISKGQFKLQLPYLNFQHYRLHTQGTVDITINCAEQNRWSISSNFTPCDINFTGLIHKPHGDNGILRFQLQQNNKTQPQWQLSNGELQFPGYRILFSGYHSNNRDYQLDLNIPEYQLETISTKIPLLEKMELKGTIAARYQLQAHANQPLTGTGQVHLKDCAIAPTFVIAPIHHVNGVISLDGFSAKAPGLSIGLGDSNMKVDAYIADLRHTVAELHATGNGVIAKDLVFHSPAALLNNLDGHIAIHAQGIDFVHIDVDLAQGTHASVSGKLSFSEPLLELDINAPYADINEVIALWHNGENTDTTQQPQTQPSQTQEFIHINTNVERGIISGFEFQNTHGFIHYQQGQLRIEPLYFEADAGFGTGAIHVTQKQPQSILTIDASVTNINADKVYRQLLQHKGVVTGQLSGDFTLQGPVGSTFLTNAQGTFHLDIKQGVLRQFSIISKAFSLLNVAQLLSFDLPDMDKEGMPFKRLYGEIALTGGIMSSENLTINSPAMGISIVGDYNLLHNNLDLLMGFKPLGTIDSLFTHIPVAGWLLAGEEQSVITSYFKVSGAVDDPKVRMLPGRFVSDTIFGIFKRTLQLPGTLITEPKKLLIKRKD